MDRQEAALRLREIIGEFLENQGIELVDLIFHYEGRDLVLRVLADLPSGCINLDECARLNREIGVMLDEKDILQEGYLLEVSSPGLDRPLYTKKDFLRNKNKLIKFFLKEMVEGKIEWDGVLTNIEGESLFIDVKGKNLEIPVAKINKAKLILE